MRLFAQAAVTPVGKPVAVPIPVAPVVVRVMLVSATSRQTIGSENVPTVLAAVTVIDPVA
jgi:hypothetical protein